MSRKTLTIIAIILQLIVLGSFIVRYEILKQTGTTVYIPLRGYDPTDIFRGDYVNLSYELPYTGSTDNYSYEQQYIIPIITGKTLTGIREVTKTQPESGIYFQIRNGWMRDANQAYTLDIGSSKTIEFSSSYCQTEGKAGDEVLYISGTTSEVQSIRVLMPEDKKNSLEQGWQLAKLVSKGACSGNYQFQTTATDRWFVPEGTGLDLEKKIRDGEMYGEWKIGSNGAVIITDVITKEKLPK